MEPQSSRRGGAGRRAVGPLLRVAGDCAEAVAEAQFVTARWPMVT